MFILPKHNSHKYLECWESSIFLICRCTCTKAQKTFKNGTATCQPTHKKSVWKQHQKTDKQNFKATGNMYQKQVFLKESAPKTTIFRKLSLSHSQRETTWTRFWYRKHTDFNKSDSAHHKISRCKIHSKIHVKEKIWLMDIWIFQKSNKQTDRGLHKKQRVWEKTYHYLN